MKLFSSSSVCLLLTLATLPLYVQADCKNFVINIFSINLTDINCVNRILSWFFGLLGPNFFDGTNSIGSNKGPVADIVQSQEQEDTNLNHFYMYFAGAAYCFDSTLTNLTCSWCGNLTTPSANYTVTNVIGSNSLDDQLVFIAISTTQQQIVVTYRGTLNVPSIIDDLTFFQVAVDSNITVHAGFNQAFQSTYSQVYVSVSALLSANPGFKLVVTGHSLGGAEAALFVYYIKSNNTFASIAPNLDIELYTYGEPRVGNQAWADYMNTLDMIIVRTVNNADIVPHLPPAVAGYFHHQTEYWINNGTANTPTYCNQSVYEDPTCSDSKGPNYNPLDHLQYYDVQLLTCVGTQPLPHLLQFVADMPAVFSAGPSTLNNLLLGIIDYIAGIAVIG